ncbi:MAG TPA: hypothetical protein VMV92_21730 [Streptosporangiaceae bacterium]|nr:hypothetical protein [Streptosporangiaceae bacterium]
MADVTTGRPARVIQGDLYELNMAASYLHRGMSGPATFSLFVRRPPSERGRGRGPVPAGLAAERADRAALGLLLVG